MQSVPTSGPLHGATSRAALSSCARCRTIAYPGRPRPPKIVLDRAAAVEQRHRGGDLLLADAKFQRNLSVDRSRHALTYCEATDCGGASRHSDPITAHIWTLAHRFFNASDLAAIEIARVEQRFREMVEREPVTRQQLLG